MLHGCMLAHFCALYVYADTAFTRSCAIFIFVHDTYAMPSTDLACGPIWPMVVCHFSSMFGIA